MFTKAIQFLSFHFSRWIGQISSYLHDLWISKVCMSPLLKRNDRNETKNIAKNTQYPSSAGSFPNESHSSFPQVTARPEMKKTESWDGSSFVKKKLLDYWQEQVGPTCASASVAGALNFLFGLKDTPHFAFSWKDVHRIYMINFDRKLEGDIRKLSNLLQGSRLVSNSVVSVFTLEAIQLIRKNKTKEALDLMQQSASIKGNHDVKSCEKFDGVSDEFIPAVRRIFSIPDSPQSALTIRLFSSIANNVWALSKLEGKLPCRNGKCLPSTSPIGNHLVSLACRSLSLFRENKRVRVCQLMGLGDQCYHRISRISMLENEEQFWSALCMEIENDQTVLIFHMRNHYSLIFGWREIKCDQIQGHARATRRQILTARRGQRPALWMDWDDGFPPCSESEPNNSRECCSVLSTLRAWRGHCILQVQIIIERKGGKQRSMDPAEREILDHLRSGCAGRETDIFTKSAAAGDSDRGPCSLSDMSDDCAVEVSE